MNPKRESKTMSAVQYQLVPSPVGELLITASGAAVTSIHFPKGEPHEIDASWERGGAVLDQAQQQLEEYFRGERTEFELPLEPEGTEFQKQVWVQLQRIPYGETISYGELARRLGNPNASRAVGAANGRNPISIVIPCHRVIGSNGALTGFGGGLRVKEQLLDLESPLFGGRV